MTADNTMKMQINSKLIKKKKKKKLGFFKHFLNPQKIQTITSLKAREISISYSPNRPFCSIVLALNNCNKLTVFLVLAAT